MCVSACMYVYAYAYVCVYACVYLEKAEDHKPRFRRWGSGITNSAPLDFISARKSPTPEISGVNFKGGRASI